MAVFTRVTHSELESWLEPLSCGNLISFQGIEAGIENTNYFVTTTKGRFVLTLFEKLTEAELPFYLSLMQHLATKGLPVPSPMATKEGQLFRILNGKPTALVNCLSGQSVESPNEQQCFEVGAFSARAHTAVDSFQGNLENPRNLEWIKHATVGLKAHLPSPQRKLLEGEIEHQSQVQQSADYKHLPRGAVHADLFHDNALMVGNDLGGVIDFYFAGVDAFLFDLAVTTNDWCIHRHTGELNPDLLRSLLQGYQGTRRFSTAEAKLWPDMLRAAALRFWVSRLIDFYMPRAGELVHTKDPKHFESILKQRIAGIPFNLQSN